MSDLDATTPRVFLIRHGETEWTKTGRFTGITEIELTPEGERQVRATGTHIVGPGKLIDEARVNCVFVSPRKRSQRTFQLLFSSGGQDYSKIADKIIITEDIAEWDYGDYEGLIASEVRGLRKEKGLDTEREYSIWRDGCAGGESAEQVSKRLDSLIARLRGTQEPHMGGELPADIVLVGHGLILRAFFKRWLNLPLDNQLPVMMSPGAISVLSYKNHDINTPGFFAGITLPS